jgi:hypothetical protein
MSVRLPHGAVFSLRERLTWHQRFTFTSPHPWEAQVQTVECPYDSIIITTAEATGIDPARASQLGLTIQVSQRTMHEVPLAAICVFDSVLEARVSDIEKLIATLIDSNATELAQIAAAFGAKRDHVDHRTLKVPVQVPRGEQFAVRLDRHSDNAGPYRTSDNADDFHVDLFGIRSREL